jgi:hypothetical protein
LEGDATRRSFFSVSVPFSGILHLLRRLAQLTELVRSLRLRLR